jgi:UDP-glucose 6-dehydrogenase
MKISIVGCGWLGLPLGEKLAKSGHQVFGSTTSVEKIATIFNEVRPYACR